MNCAVDVLVCMRGCETGSGLTEAVFMAIGVSLGKVMLVDWCSDMLV